MTETRRVALLARPGEACERLRAALAEAGGEIVLEADPSTLAAETLRASSPQVVLIALEPSVEVALDRFDSVLGDPSVAVIFDEAELAARRTGWDAARWTRHLRAKLSGSDDVLPPGREPEHDMLPLPGRPPSPGQRDADVPLASFANEAETVAPQVPSEPVVGEPKRASIFGELSLVDDAPVDTTDAAATASNEAADALFKNDLEDLQRRIAAMDFSDAPAAASAPAAVGSAHARGAVLILAGIGGPDAVRQILTALPQTFSLPVLISQRLDGGRYDRLVQQMARATSLPVHLAEAGVVAAGGNIYIVPPELGVAESDNTLRFVANAPLLAGLPASDSAIFLLSGSDPATVDAAMAHAARGALVAGQAPEGCYDGAAPNALIARGGNAGSPADLVQQLLKRWPA
ncbi:chemotaxis protein CheB [Lysobacter sp. CFH 32150]|uniref:chemotaxis protein CheB n=1 Tax=Lysobacter sp. CFH 32150 TaxID=2927128 RepID=UPI001FA78DFE|nr:chemotaxis protein CheB [Lysobacter sp. CFH 32150]MCI4567811.1 chemotaxis protein [Lysobacter sp. CFH 32150]